jgi:hypothetical protein
MHENNEVEECHLRQAASERMGEQCRGRQSPVDDPRWVWHWSPWGRHSPVDAQMELLEIDE